MRIAICYFGILRNLKKTIESHNTYLFHKLKEANIEFDVYVHTWIGQFVNRRGHNSQEYNIDTDDYKLLNPYKFLIDNQDEFIKSLNFEDYFKQDIFLQYGEGRSTEWFPDLILFHLCSIESQRRVVNLAKEQNKDYSKILMLRPDIIFDNNIPISCFLDITPKIVYIPSTDEGEGYNDRLALFNYNEIEPYSNRINKIKDYRNNVGRIVGEKYLKYVLDTNMFHVELIPLNTNLLR